MLPRIKIQFLNGQLGTVGESPDGLVAIAVTAAAVEGAFELETPYTIYKPEDLTDLGVTAENNATLVKHVGDFYNEAEEGTKLVVWGFGSDVTLTAACNKTSGTVRKLIVAMNGALRAVFVGLAETVGEVKTDEGLSSDTLDAIAPAQATAEWATTELYAPLFIVLEGREYVGGSKTKDLSQLTANRVAVLIGDTVADSKGAMLGVMAGRVAECAVQRNIGRVKDGALYPTTMYIGSEKVDTAESTIATLYDLGYITVRKYVGRSGYYFADDRLATESTDDYSHVTARRVIDKAYRIAYDALLDMMLDELEVNEDGTLQTGVVKAWQQTVENAVNRQMTASGELSASEDGDGCTCYIDETQNVVSTSTVAVTLKVRPYGYARYIDVKLGFLVES